ncbi:hypothetical protein LINPERHAP2_LOCUS14756, partial [Linum perenne]
VSHLCPVTAITLTVVSLLSPGEEVNTKGRRGRGHATFFKYGRSLAWKPSLPTSPPTPVSSPDTSPPLRLSPLSSS